MAIRKRQGRRAGGFRPRVERLEGRELPSLAPAVNYGTGNTPVAVAAADFNGDGNTDLATANFGGRTVSVLLNGGTGTFQPATDYPAGGGPFAVAAGDFNGDARPDLAVADFSGGSVQVLLNHGDGTLGKAVAYPAGFRPAGVAVGKLNADDALDLAVTNQGGTVSVLLGKGDGTFEPAVNYAAGVGPQEAALADVNGDGTLDLAVADAGDLNQQNAGVSVLFGNGDGTFQAAATYAAGPKPHSVALGNFDGDGKIDLAVASQDATTISVLLNNGDGTFAAPADYAVPPSPQAVAAGDVTGDGALDLVTANGVSNNVSVLAGTGKGAFQPAVNYPVDPGPNDVALADLNGDGASDVATANGNAGTASVLLSHTGHVLATGADAGGLPEVHVYDALTGKLQSSFLAYDSRFRGGVRVAVGDVTGDGTPDIITAPGPTGGPDVRVFDGLTGALAWEFMAFDPGFLGGAFVAAGDLPGDSITTFGNADVVVGAGEGGGPHVKAFSGATHKEFASFYASDPAFGGGVRVAVADVNGDGARDVISGAGPGGGPHVKVFDGPTVGTSALGVLQSYYAYDPSFAGGVFVAVGDTDGDGKADAVTGPGGGDAPLVKVFSGADGSVLRSFPAYAAGFPGAVRVAAVADVNGDGGADIATGAGPGGGPHVRVFDGLSGAALDSFYAYDPQFPGGVFVGGA